MKEKLITEKSGKALSVENPKTPRFYMLPKIHKPNNPGRPVVSSVNSPSSNISQYADFYLQPIVQSLKAYIKDTTDFINKIDGITELPAESILVTMDVRSLYTNIPHREGINAVAKALENIKETQISTRVIIKLLSLILHLNNFSFNGKHYQQTQGCTMGSKCSPSYANLFMGDFEEKFIYPKIKNKSACYYRFIDDIFMIWTGTKEELLRFFQDINLQHQSIKFDYSYSTSEISFLDTVVFKNKLNTLSTKLYTKPTDRSAYLHQKSYHPKSLKDNIPFGQALRVKRICTEVEDLDQALSELKDKFLQRGYKEYAVSEQIEKVKSIERKEILTKKKTKKSSKIHFPVTYNTNLPTIKKAIDKNWNILSINREMSDIFNEKPIISFKRNKNLRELIGQFI